MAVGRPFGAKLYIEGREVPFIGASLTATVNTASIAYIDLVPQQEINNIKPRTHVVIAVRDYNNEKDNYPYVLAWEGEVFGYSFGKTTSSRSFTLQCIDLTGYWDNVLTYFVNTLHAFGGSVQSQATIGSETLDAKAAGQKVQTTGYSLKSYLRKIIEEKKGAQADFLDGFTAIYQDISQINAFYGFAEQRFRIAERIVLRSTGKLNDFLGSQEAIDWLEGIATRTAGYSSLRSVIQDLLSVIFHDYTTVPFPGRVTGGLLKGKPLPGATKEKKTVGQFVFKPNLYMIPAPLCNVFFPDEYSSFQFRRNFFQEPTRMNYRPELPRFLTGTGIVMPNIYEPAAYEDFMLGQKGSQGDGSADATGTSDKDQGGKGGENTGASAAINPRLREGEFLTNEERIKGIFLANEKMVPATTTLGTALGAIGRKSFLKQVSSYLFAKKRFQDRGLQITSHLKLSVVPGFSVLILDDSDADQNVLAYCSSVTHRIYATEGGYTNTTLSYARLATELDPSSNRAAEPIVPPWYDEDIFGKVTTPPESTVAKDEVSARGNQLVTPVALTTFYRDLLGSKSGAMGSQAFTNYKASEATIIGSVRALLEDYRFQKEKGGEAIQDFIAKITGRDYIKIRDYFDFLGAESTSNEADDDSFATYTGASYKGEGLDVADAADFVEQVKQKGIIIDNYRQKLVESRGFRG